MKEILLSIVIPTRNRASYLKETIDYILSDLIEDIEIIIVDGGSIDDTQIVVNQFSEDYDFIKYIKITNPLGFDAELDMGVKSSTGAFSWIFSDDDHLLGRDVNEIVKYLNLNQSIDLLMVNASIWDKNFTNLIQMKFLDTPTISSNNMNDLFINHIDYLSFLGGCIIKKSTWITSNSSLFFGTMFVHVGVIFSNKSLRWHWINDPVVSIRYGNASWSANSQKIWLTLWPKLLNGFESISDSVKQKKVELSYFSLLKKLVFYKAQGFYNKQTIIDIEVGISSFDLKILKIIMNFIPKYFCRHFSLQYAKLTRKSLMIYDLTK
jgi:abequosyltransferase